jgi:hypothetical protein
MVYCAGFGCNNQAKKENGLSICQSPPSQNLSKEQMTSHNISLGLD